MAQDALPSRDKLIQVLKLIGRTEDGRPLNLDDKHLMQDETLLGMLDAVVDTIARQLNEQVGRGNSRRIPFVLGYERYLEQSGQHGRHSLTGFYQQRLERLAADMNTSLHLSSHEGSA